MMSGLPRDAAPVDIGLTSAQSLALLEQNSHYVQRVQEKFAVKKHDDCEPLRHVRKSVHAMMQGLDSLSYDLDRWKQQVAPPFSPADEMETARDELCSTALLYDDAWTQRLTRRVARTALPLPSAAASSLP